VSNPSSRHEPDLNQTHTSDQEVAVALHSRGSRLPSRDLFSDLVVSGRGRAGAARWAAPMPASMLLHGGALATVLVLVPLMKATVPPVVAVVQTPLTFPARMAPVVRVDPAGGAPRRAVRRATFRPPGRAFVAPAAIPEAVASAVEDTTPPDVGSTAEVGIPCVGCVDPGVAPGPGDGSGIGEGDGTGTQPPGPVRVGQGVVEPRKRRHVDPVYPDLARVAGIGATVILECQIDVNGRVADIKILRGHPLFENAAIDAVRQWVYTPSLLNGQPVSVLMTVTVRFIPRR
jgi:periplasmic protein TonB